MDDNQKNELWKSSIKFIVADDEEAVRKLVVTRLKREGFTGRIFEATNGKEALDLFYDKEVDCIISDWNMPELSGVEFVEKVRKGLSRDSLAILMVTGESTMGRMEQALDSGVDDYLTKPFTPEDFKRKIERVLRKIKEKKMGSMGGAE